MAAYDANWQRWIMSSINKHFETNKGSLNLFFEGAERRTGGFQDWIELRMDGVWWREVNKDNWKGKLDINVLISTVIGSDIYQVDRMIGDVTAILTSCIEIFKYGSAVGDDGTSLGYITLLASESGDGHRTHKYGQIEPKVKLIQATVECSYRIWL